MDVPGFLAKTRRANAALGFIGCLILIFASVVIAFNLARDFRLEVLAVLLILCYAWGGRFYEYWKTGDFEESFDVPG